jgi:NAD(P)-dependent dehydrogenase (short-subunit alcohol dehydrogenase family)
MKFPSQPTAVVTGGGSGLGREVCLLLARQKANVLVADLNLERAEDTVRMVRELGGEAFAMKCDVAKPADVEALAIAADQRWGGTDLLVNNAGVAAGGAMGEISLEDWQWIVNINMWGMIYGCHYFVPRMKQRGRGWILNVASAAGLASLPEMASYNVTKAAIVALSETLFGELKKDGIAVTVLCPTFFKTNLMESMRSPTAKSKNAAQAFFDRAKISAQEVARQGLAGLQKGKLYVIPQADGKAMWRLKRLNPQFYFEQVAKQLAKGMMDKLAASASKKY